MTVVALALLLLALSVDEARSDSTKGASEMMMMMMMERFSDGVRAQRARTRASSVALSAEIRAFGSGFRCVVLISVDHPKPKEEKKKKKQIFFVFFFPLHNSQHTNPNLWSLSTFSRSLSLSIFSFHLSSPLLFLPLLFLLLPLLSHLTTITTLIIHSE
jgi:hypothetical protein